ncbi:UDP-GlcNAc:undecaprenyl-phosphate GlcNAc-1-phosphate transferase [Natranaerovirga hydrolytica]|uniref:UDP-GlcNAc:undecaprenyl-phosphate GlcNAc-1-phosphate transferase n=1 Tax=Natranaerovirga hydrolytica TaxID=680378 RepID=A0A4R1M963_9FIRM|nr:MraY family glycosyltransferase [Natranaerovirga hydrolytica]TCK87910.1 UDP-GlcNAc:undecaprenyl-phosphate GlcNAc-1-phosphate transferase [Natranaerovirga hydrolytica]
MLKIINGLNPSYIYILAFGIAFAISLLMTPVSKKIAFKIGAIDYPKSRGMHKKPMPLAGGIAIVSGFMLTVIFIVPFMNGVENVQLMGLIFGGILITSVGLLDDVHSLSPKIKLSFQIIAALIVVYTGTTIEYFSWPFSSANIIELGAMSKLVTMVWVIGVTNAVNLIDGLDGLAAGVSSIAALCLMLLSILTPVPIPVTIVLTAALAGSCLGFLPYNFNPAKIFMGDTGSTFLGFTLAVISIQGLMKSYTAVTVFVAVLVLGLPIFDTFFAIFRRVISGRPVMEADRGHLHHRLVDRGYSQKRAVLTLYGISSCFGLAGILFALTDALVAFILLATMLIVWVIDNFIIVREKSNKQKHKL